MLENIAYTLTNTGSADNMLSKGSAITALCNPDDPSVFTFILLIFYVTRICVYSIRNECPGK